MKLPQSLRSVYCYLSKRHLAYRGSGRPWWHIAYTLRYTSEVRSQSDYFRDIKETEIGEESLELAESHREAIGHAYVQQIAQVYLWPRSATSRVIVSC